MRVIRLVFILALCWSFISCINGYNVVTRDPSTASQPAPSINANSEISILIWNIGYAGLGANTDFITDGGKKIISSSKKQVKKNLKSIKTFLRGYPAEIILIQEMALPSNVNRFVNIYEEITNIFPSYWSSYSPKVDIVFGPVTVNVGGSILTRFEPISVERMELPLEEKGVTRVKQKHHLLIARFYISGLSSELVLVNVHLSAFDENAAIRYKQLKALNKFIRKEYDTGNYVICGGDWNLVLDGAMFPYTTEEKYLFWVYNLPPWFPPAGWKKAADPSAPTVRSLERPYIKNENYTTIIDGFVMSPNVELIGVKTINREFSSSDHNPVQVKIKLTHPENNIPIDR
ncbi:MAG TPA: hypothetical protein ENI15_05835 [Spirochaetes bacterium]|nr:hypothetical protein [Spirochaetota bacterium]